MAEREFLAMLQAQLRRIHAQDMEQTDAPVHISTVTARMPELEPIRR
jgi:hypothetical protein